MNYHISNIEETKNIAKEFADILTNGDIIILNGKLGIGKTFLVKNILLNFGIHNVTSPTYSIVNEYYGDKNFYHFDFYRLNNVEELYDIGFEEYINDKNSITFIEWGELFPEIIPKRRTEVKFILNDDSTRDIIIKKYE